VLGFYLLVFLGPNGPGGQFTQWLGIGILPFTFSGLVVGSVIYSLPFYLQPVVNAFSQLGPRPLEIASSLGMPPLSRFLRVGIPLAKSGIGSGSLLAFVHTLGEFGVILMLGGSIPGRTQVVSVAIFDHVEALEYREAHFLSLGLVLMSFVILAVVINKRWSRV
jgi:molybdate transport system permease protein